MVTPDTLLAPLRQAQSPRLREAIAEWDPRKHPRDGDGRFAEKLSAMKPGEDAQVGGVKVRATMIGFYSSDKKRFLGRNSDEAARKLAIESPGNVRAIHDQLPSVDAGFVRSRWGAKPPPEVKTYQDARAKVMSFRPEQVDSDEFEAAHKTAQASLNAIKAKALDQQPTRKGKSKPAQTFSTPKGTKGFYYHEMLGREFNVEVVSPPDKRGYMKIRFREGGDSIPAGTVRRVKAGEFGRKSVMSALKASAVPDTILAPPLREATGGPGSLPGGSARATGGNAPRRKASSGGTGGPGSLPGGNAPKPKREPRKQGKSSGSSSWDESKHPRGATGSPKGGKFVSKGSSGKEAAAVNERLGVKGKKFGDASKKAVEAFQKKRGLKVDGIVGTQTVAALKGSKGAKSAKPGKLSDTDIEYLRKGAPRKGKGKDGKVREAARSAHKLAVLDPDRFSLVARPLTARPLGEREQEPAGLRIKPWRW